MKYSEEQRRKALETYMATRSVTKTIRLLGLQVSCGHFYRWINKAGLPVREAKPAPSLATKLKIVHRCFNLGMSVQSVSKETGFSKKSIYRWRKKYLEGGDSMRKARKKANGNASMNDWQATEKDKRIAELEAQLEERQFEIDFLNATIDELKKSEGASKALAKARTKAAIAGALKEKYPLPKALKRVGLAKSSYYCQKDKRRIAAKRKKEEERKALVSGIFFDNNEIYGYRRIKACLERTGHVISEKVIRRIMKALSLMVKGKRARKYSSYAGEITAAPENLVRRNFHAGKPNEKWLTDITEFSIPAGKAYLSLLMDCFDGMPVAWTVGTSPNAELANGSLKKAIATLHEGERPILHSDRGCHYRWPEWIKMTEEAGIARSMSKKGCSPDNAACEGFFGRMKQEMFYGRDWSAASLDGFIKAIDGYLAWYCKGRIKTALGNLTPMEHRQRAGFAA